MHANTDLSFLRIVARHCLCIGLALSLVAGCDERKAGDNNNALPDAAVDAEPDAGTLENMTVLVLGSTIVDGTFIPAPGATVAFDAPGGGRTEQVTGADGRTTFHGIDWSAGDAAISVHIDSVDIYRGEIRSYVNLDAAEVESMLDENGDVRIFPTEVHYDYPNYMPVTGSATGLVDVAHTYTVGVVNATVYSVDDTSDGDSSFQLWVPVGEPFVLQAFEWDYTALPSGRGYDRPIYNVMHMDYGPITAEATGVVLDFGAHPMATHSADVSLLLPSRVDSPLRAGVGIPECSFCERDRLSCTGWSTYVDVVDNNNRVDVSFLWVEPAWAQSATWRCMIVGAEAMSFTDVLGAPLPDSQERFIDAPTWVTPSDPEVAHSLGDPIEWQWYEDVTWQRIVVRSAGTHVWTMYARPGTTTATFPQPPSTVNLTQLMGAGLRSMSIEGGSTNSDGTVFRYAGGLSRTVAAP